MTATAVALSSVVCSTFVMSCYLMLALLQYAYKHIGPAIAVFDSVCLLCSKLKGV